LTSATPSGGSAASKPLRRSAISRSLFPQFLDTFVLPGVPGYGVVQCSRAGDCTALDFLPHGRLGRLGRAADRICCFSSGPEPAPIRRAPGVIVGGRADASNY
jgi:hypothetical protein